MIERDAARDELADAAHALYELAASAPTSEQAIGDVRAWLLSRGYRRSVTPDEIREAANAMLLVDIPVPMKMARAAARAFGLEVGE